MKKRPWKHYSLGIILVIMWLGSWTLQFVFQLPLEMNDASQHGQPFVWGEFWVSFFKDTFENWQSEFLQVFTLIVLTKYFVFQGSPESKEPQEVEKTQ